MTLQEAQAELTDLRGLAAKGQDLALVRGRIERLYWQVCRKTLRQCNCKDILRDALIEIYIKLKTTDMANINDKARLVAGVVIFWRNNHYTNANLTDEVAREFLAAFPQRTDWFEVLPSEVAEEKPAESTETASAATEAPSEPVAPKKKKTAKKRK